jgi:hypothetical protein
MSGRAGDLSAAQAKALKDFQAEVKEAPEDAALRNLRVCQFDVAKSVAKYNAMIAWRAENKIDELHANVDKDLMVRYGKILPNVHLGFDKEDRPVYYQKTGVAQGDLLRFLGPLQGQTICHVWDMENKRIRSLEQTKKLGRLIDTHTNVLDMEGLTLSIKDLLPILNFVTDQDLKYYPETLGQTIVLNAPSFAPMMWGLIQKFLDPEVAKRVVILSYDYKETLLKLIDKSQVPKQFGGEHSFEFPKFDYQTTLQWFEDEEKKMGCSTTNVAAGSTLDLTEDVEQGANLKISYAFRTVGYDIYFSIDFVPADTKTKVSIVPSTRYDSHKCKIFGKVEYKVPSKGQIVCSWDNSQSYWNAKNVTQSVNFEILKK